MSAKLTVAVLLVLALASAPFAVAEPDDNPLKAAKELIKKQRYEEAIATLTQAIAADATNAELHARRSQAYLESGKPTLAIADLTEAIKLDPSNRNLLLDRARAYDSQGATAEAIKDCSKALVLKKDAAIYQLRAALYEKSGQNSAAIQDYTELIKAQPFRPDHFLARGKIYRATGQAQFASEDFGRSIRLNPTYKIQVMRIMSETVAVKPMVVKPTLANILPDTKSAAPEILVQPERQVVVQAKTAKKDKPTQGTSSGVETASAPRPVRAPALAPVEPLVLPQARPEAKVETVALTRGVPPKPSTPASAAPAPPSKETALVSTPSANSAMQKGRTQMDAKQYSEAIASFTAVIDARPKSADGYTRRCMANFLAGNLKPAHDDCDKALTLKTDDADALYFRGRVLQAEKAYKPAVESYSVAISVRPYFPDAFYYRAQASQSMDDLASAIYNYSEAARQRQGFTEALQARADIKLQLGDRLGYQKDLDLLKAVNK